MGIFSKLRKPVTPADDKKSEQIKAGEKTQVSATPAAENKPSGKVNAGLLSLTNSKGQEIILRPMITEKSAHLHSLSQYVFEVALRANKVEIAKAIKAMYGVNPIKVNISITVGKTVQRNGRVRGNTSAYKKAIVTLKKGESIKIYEGV